MSVADEAARAVARGTQHFGQGQKFGGQHVGGDASLTVALVARKDTMLKGVEAGEQGCYGGLGPARLLLNPERILAEALCLMISCYCSNSISD